LQGTETSTTLSLDFNLDRNIMGGDLKNQSLNGPYEFFTSEDSPKMLNEVFPKTVYQN